MGKGLDTSPEEAHGRQLSVGEALATMRQCECENEMLLHSCRTGQIQAADIARAGEDVQPSSWEHETILFRSSSPIGRRSGAPTSNDSLAVSFKTKHTPSTQSGTRTPQCLPQ